MGRLKQDPFLLCIWSLELFIYKPGAFQPGTGKAAALPRLQRQWTPVPGCGCWCGVAVIRCKQTLWSKGLRARGVQDLVLVATRFTLHGSQQWLCWCVQCRRRCSTPWLYLCHYR